MEKNDGRLILGLFLIILGVGFLADQTGLLNSFGITFGEILSSLWPLFFAGIGVLFLSRNRVGLGLFFLVVGAMMFISQIFDLDFWSVFWPLMIIGLGAKILLRQSNHAVSAGQIVSNGNDALNETAIFNEIKRKIVSKKFKGGSVDVTFGSAKIDLRETKIAEEGAELKVSSLFGGIEIYVPKEMCVKPDGSAVFGGWDNNFSSSSDTAAPQLVIKGSAYFGSIEIRN